MQGIIADHGRMTSRNQEEIGFDFEVVHKRVLIICTQNGLEIAICVQLSQQKIPFICLAGAAQQSPSLPPPKNGQARMVMPQSWEGSIRIAAGLLPR